MRARWLSIALLLSFAVPFISPNITHAGVSDEVLEKQIQQICNNADRNSSETPAICEVDYGQTKSDNFLVGEDGILTRLTQVMIWLSGTLALIMIIIAGLMFMFSSGNAESTAKAKRTMLYAVIGMIVAVVGQIIVTFVLDKL